jgi:hypothetical protein
MGIGQARFYKSVGPYRGKNVHFSGYEPPNLAQITRIALGPELHHAVGDIVRDAIVYAELIAPNDEGEYQASFRTEVIEVPDIPYRVRGKPFARWSGRVINDSRHAILVEVGGGNGPRFTADHRVLRRTLEWIEAVTGG